MRDLENMDSSKEYSSVNTISLESRASAWVPFLLSLSFFILPLGGDLRNIVFPLSALLIFSIPAYRKDLWPLIPSFYVLPMFLFYLWIIIACCWGPATLHEQLSVLQKYSKLLFFGIFALGFRNPRARAQALYAFIAAAIVPCCLSILNAFDIYKYKGLQDPGHVFVNHVATGFLLAFASYLCFFLAYKQRRWKSLALFVPGLLFAYQVLFINTGRTGYAAWLLLMLLLCLQLFSWKKAIFAGLVLGILFSLSYFLSPVMQSGVKYFINDVRHYQENKDTSIGFRMQFHAYAKSLFLKHPLAGNGSGAYGHCYDRDRPTPAFTERANPHSQYWLVLVEQGIIGLGLLILTFGSLIYIALRATDYGPILLGFLTIIVFGGFNDSILMLSPIGQILVILSSLCLGELLSLPINRRRLKIY